MFITIYESNNYYMIFESKNSGKRYQEELETKHAIIALTDN